MSKKEHLIMKREDWENMRYLDKKTAIKQRYERLLELMDDELEVNLY
ncbi:MAG: hypothetical protein ACFFAT_04380 [Promethearchaeota archaeon]